jgi:cytochrome d ubiquinol oxidase subunit I
MIALGFLFPILAFWAWLRRNRLVESPRLLKVLMFALPLPYLAVQAGWVVAEVGRQPWVVYGVMKTADAVSPIAAQQVAVSLAAFVLVYSLLGAAAFYLIGRHARRGPEPSAVES